MSSEPAQASQAQGGGVREACVGRNGMPDAAPVPVPWSEPWFLTMYCWSIFHPEKPMAADGNAYVLVADLEVGVLLLHGVNPVLQDDVVLGHVGIHQGHLRLVGRVGQDSISHLQAYAKALVDDYTGRIATINYGS